MTRFDDPLHPDWTQRPPWVQVRLALPRERWPDREMHPWLVQNCPDGWFYYGGGLFRFKSEMDATLAVLAFAEGPI